MWRLRLMWLALVATLSLLAPPALRDAVAPPSTPPISTYLAPPARVVALARLERSAPVYDVTYRYGAVTSAASGAYGPNISAPRSAWYIEYQRAGATDVFDGVFRDDPLLISEGLRMFHFGLSREASNGSFPGSAWPFHGTAMFLSEAAPSLLVLAASQFGARFVSEVGWESVRMRRAARYMVRWVGGPNRIDDSTKNHRFYEAAIALGATGALTGDKTLTRWSTDYAARGIAMERQDGVMPEDGGHDSGYQALGMINAERYLVLVAAGRLSSRLRAAVARGESWEISRIRPDGSINQAGDTRTAGCRERDPLGQCKTAFYAPIFGALARWGTISGNAAFSRLALLVWHRSGYGSRPS